MIGKVLKIPLISVTGVSLRRLRFFPPLAACAEMSRSLAAKVGGRRANGPAEGTAESRERVAERRSVRPSQRIDVLLTKREKTRISLSSRAVKLNFTENGLQLSARCLPEESTRMESTATETILKNIEREIKEFKSSYAARNLEVDARFEKIDAKFESIDSKFDKIDNRFSQIDNRFESIDNRFSQIDGKFEKIDGKFDQMSNKIDSKFDQTNDKIDKLTERIHRNEMKVYGVSLVVALAASAAIRYFLA